MLFCLLTSRLWFLSMLRLEDIQQSPPEPRSGSLTLQASPVLLPLLLLLPVLLPLQRVSVVRRISPSRRASDNLALEVVFSPLMRLNFLPLARLLLLALLAESRRPAAPVDECLEDDAEKQ